MVALKSSYFRLPEDASNICFILRSFHVYFCMRVLIKGASANCFGKITLSPFVNYFACVFNKSSNALVQRATSSSVAEGSMKLIFTPLSGDSTFLLGER